MMVWLFLTFAVRICCPKDFEEHDADEQIVEGAENRESPNMGGAYRTTTELTFVGNKNLPPSEDDNRRIEDAVDEQLETENE